MEYRIKNPYLRQALENLFGENLVFNFNMEISQATAKLSLRTPYELPYTEEIELEPVQDLAEGWNPYPEEKPKDVAQFLVARKRDSSSVNDFGVAHWGGGFFYPVDSDIIAWREIPKIWKAD